MLALLGAAAGCDREPRVRDEPPAACCAFDSPIEVMVVDEGTWPLVTDAGGRAVVDPGILGTFAVAVTPPPGYELAPGEAPADTVATSRERPGAAVTFRLARRGA